METLINRLRIRRPRTNPQPVEQLTQAAWDATDELAYLLELSSEHQRFRGHLVQVFDRQLGRNRTVTGPELEQLTWEQIDRVTDALEPLRAALVARGGDGS